MYNMYIDHEKVINTLWWTNIAMENGPVEIVDFPINSMVDLSSSLCKRSPEDIFPLNPIKPPLNHH